MRSNGFPETRPSLIREIGDDATGGTWRDFFDLYAPAIYRVARARGLVRHDAEDIVQQVMLSVLSHIAGFDYQRDRGRFRAWIRRIAENKITDQFRRQGRAAAASGRAALAEVDGGTSLDEAWNRQWRRQDLLYCLQMVEADISPRRMEAFRLSMLHGVPPDETARRLEMSVGHVYAVRSLVMSMLRRQMAKLERAELERGGDSGGDGGGDGAEP